MSLKDKIVAMVREAPVTAYDVSVELGVSQKVARAHLSNHARTGLLREVAKVPTTADAKTLCTLYAMGVPRPRAKREPVRTARVSKLARVVEALESGAATCPEVAAVMGVPPAVVGPNLSRLAELGVIRKAGKRQDRRGRFAVAEWEFVRRTA